MEIKFGAVQGTFLLVIMVCSKLFFITPQLFVDISAMAAWISILIKFIILSALMAIMLRLYKKFEGKDILDLSKTAFGEAGKIVCGLILILFFMIGAFITLKLFANAVKSIALPLSPYIFTSVFFVTVMLVGAYVGLKAQTGVHTIVMFISFAVALFILYSVVPYLRPMNVLPILGAGPKAVFWDSIYQVNPAPELITFFIIAPFLQDYKTVKKTCKWTLIISGTLFFIFTLMFIMVIPYQKDESFYVPIYQLTKMIKGGQVWQMVEPLFLFAWALNIFGYLSAALYFMAYLFQKSFGLKHYKPLLPALAFIVFMLTNLLTSDAIAVSISKKFLDYSHIVFPILPLVVLAVAALRKKNKAGAQLEIQV